MSHVVVVGAGLAGLAAACHLVGRGHRVTVFEGQDRPGGRAGALTQDGFIFDTGPVVPKQPPRLFTPTTKKRLVSSGFPGPTRLSHQPTFCGWSA